MSGDVSADRADAVSAAGIDRTARLANRVLVIGDDNKSVLATIRSLGRAGKEIHVVPFDWHAPCLRSRYVTEVHRLPRHAESADLWTRSLRKLLDRMPVDLIIPCCDRGILLLTRHRHIFADQRMALPQPNKAAEVLLDKVETRRLAASLSVPIPPGRKLRHDEDPLALAEDFGLPLYLKPRRSYTLQQLGRRGIVRFANDQEGLSAALAAIDDPDLWLVEGHFDGVGVGYSVLAWEGLVHHAFQHLRLREADVGSSSLRVSEPLASEMGSAVERMVKELHFSGVCMFEFRRGADGSFVLLEANPRLWGSLPLPVALGVDFPLYLYDLMVEGRSHHQVAYEVGVRSRNLLQDGHNALQRLRHPGKAGLSGALLGLADYLAHPASSGLLGREKSDSFVRDDMAPGFAELAQIFLKMRNRHYLAEGDSERRRRHPGPATPEGIL